MSCVYTCVCVCLYVFSMRQDVEIRSSTLKRREKPTTTKGAFCLDKKCVKAPRGATREEDYACVVAGVKPPEVKYNRT